MADISILVPVYNEAESLEQLCQEISDVARAGGYDQEIIFVDDGSDDGSWDVMSRLAASDSQIKCLRFRKNFGKASALQAGIDTASGRFVMTMDADLQDDPAELPNFLALIEQGYDVVSGWKKTRRDPLSKRLPSKLFNWLVSWLSSVNLHDHNCGLKLYRREVFEDFKLYGERHRFIPVLAAARGWKVAEMPVNHRPRLHGHSKYNWRRLPKGFLDLITISFLTGFNHRPQHLLGGFGLASFGLGTIGMVWMAIYWVLRMVFYPEWEPLHRRPVVIYSLGALLLGAQLLCMGFLAELLTSYNLHNSDRTTYSISQRINAPPQPANVNDAHDNGASNNLDSPKGMHSSPAAGRSETV